MHLAVIGPQPRRDREAVHVLAHVVVIEVHGVRNFGEARVAITLVALEVELLAQRVLDDDVVATGEVIDSQRMPAAKNEILLQAVELLVGSVVE